MMRALRAMIGLTLRQGMRSRFVPALALLLAGILTLLPAVIRGDGTLEGRLHVLLAYTLGTATAVLAAGTLWFGCGLVADDITRRRVHLMAVKPLAAPIHWLGRWLGLVAIQALLLVFVGILIAGGVYATIRRAPPAERARAVDAMLSAHYRLEPIDRQVDRTGIVFVFDLPARGDHDAAELRYRFLAPRRDVPRFAAEWQALGDDGAVTARVPTRDALDGPNRVRVSAPGPGLRRWRYVMTDPSADAPDALIFHPDHPVEWRLPGGGFAANLARALALTACRLALLAAVGIAAGCCLSGSVALVAAVGVVAGTMLVHAFGITSAFASGHPHPHHHDHDHDHDHDAAAAAAAPALTARIGTAMAERLTFAVRPVMRHATRGRLADGERIPWADVGGAFAVLVLLYGTVFGAIGSLALAGREPAGAEGE